MHSNVYGIFVKHKNALILNKNKIEFCLTYRYFLVWGWGDYHIRWFDEENVANNSKNKKLYDFFPKNFGDYIFRQQSWYFFC